MLERKISIKDVSYCGEYRYGKKFPAEMNISKERELVFVKEGSAIFTVNGKAFLLNEGDILFNNKGKIVSQIPTGEGAVVVMAGFSADAPSLFDGAVFRLAPSQHSYIENMVKLSENLENESYGEKALLLIALYMEILMTVLSDEIIMNDSAEYNARLFSEYGVIFSAIEKNIGEKLTLPELALKTGMSEVNIKRIVRECAGCGVSALVSAIRLIRAKELLASGMKASVVAQALGFENKNYFSIFFKREAGISLREYKGMISNEGNL